VERKSLHPRIKQFYESFSRKPAERRSDWQNLAETNTAGAPRASRSARLEAVARELRKIGYIVMVNARKSGMVVITRDDEPND
jgi:hypothetical protein